jgi:hypothetical protein
MGHRPDWNNQNFKKTPAVRKFADGSPGGVTAEEREAVRDNSTVEREPIVDTYEYGRADEIRNNEERYARDQAETADRQREMERLSAEADRELSTIREVKSAPKSFSQAFAENRKAGNKTFEWNGKLYGTELAKAKPAAQPPAKLDKVTVTAKRDEPKPEPRKFMGREVVETPAQRKASEAYKQANPFLRDSVKRGQGKDYK